MSSAVMLQAEYPHLVPANCGTLVGCALAAENIRRELARAFPGVQFRVVVQRFADGESVNVRWTDGPSDTAVAAITRKYQWSIQPERAKWTEVFGEAKTVLLFRSWSADTKAVLVSHFEAHRDSAEPPIHRARRLFDAASIPAGATVAGVERGDGEGRIICAPQAM